ncbi:MAG: FkbM family methyltransferase [Pseudomonadota bacterium]
MIATSLGFLRSLAIYHNPLALARWTRFYKGIITQGDLVFDIGAHVGNRSRAMRRAGGRVVAVEPQRPFSTFLQRTLPPDITVLDVAVGRENTEATLAVSSRHPTVSTISADFVRSGSSATGFEHVAWDDAQVVEVVTLDDLIIRFGVPRYVKIDVEGAEAEVLAGLSQPLPLISVEYLPAMPDLGFALVDQLGAMGNTRFNVVVGETGAFLWRKWQSSGEVQAWLKQLAPDAQSGDLFASRAETVGPGN